MIVILHVALKPLWRVDSSRECFTVGMSVDPAEDDVSSSVVSIIEDLLLDEFIRVLSCLSEWFSYPVLCSKLATETVKSREA